jgi:hypothetical protein
VSLLVNIVLKIYWQHPKFNPAVIDTEPNGAVCLLKLKEYSREASLAFYGKEITVAVSFSQRYTVEEEVCSCYSN